MYFYKIKKKKKKKKDNLEKLETCLRNRHAGKESAKLRADISSVKKALLLTTLKLVSLWTPLLRLEYGLDGRWGVISSKVQDASLSKVSPNNFKTKHVVFKPTSNIPTNATLYNPSDANHYNPKPILVWRPKTIKVSPRPFCLARPNISFPYSVNLTQGIRCLCHVPQ